MKLNLETELRRNGFGASGERYKLLRASGSVMSTQGRGNTMCTDTHVCNQYTVEDIYSGKFYFKLLNQTRARKYNVYRKPC